MNAERIRVTLFGAGGRMGRAAMKALTSEDDIAIIHAVDTASNAGAEIEGIVLDADGAGKDFGADVWVDVSLADAAYGHAMLAEMHRIPILIGATGFSEEQANRLSGLDTAHIIAPNLSVGVNLLFDLAPKVRKILGAGYDTAVSEIHHRHKQDAPSGTARHLVELLENAGGADAFPAVQVTSLRLGEIVGEHRLIFASEGEELELVHRARSRAAFAHGIAPAVRFLAGRKSGNYTMADVLGLRGSSSRGS